MRGAMSSADRNAWLEALVVALAADACRSQPISAQLTAACERHLRDNSRANVSASYSLH